jgi:hypothetical protein
LEEAIDAHSECEPIIKDLKEQLVRVWDELAAKKDQLSSESENGENYELRI